MPNATRQPSASSVEPVPALAVRIAGEPLPPDVLSDLLEVTVQDDVEALSMFTLRLSAWDSKKNVLAWVDDSRFEIGSPVEIKLGYPGALSTVMAGEITGLDLELGAGEIGELVVRGYDRRHRLLRGTRTRSFAGVKDSDIAATIARDAGLFPDVVDSKIKLEHMLQCAESDLHFLVRRAAAIGYEVAIHDKTLVFRPRAAGRAATLQLPADADMLDFSARLSAWGQAGEAVVRSWDPKAKKAIVATATAPAASGPKAADSAFGRAVTTLVTEPVATQAEADALAAAQVQRAALGFLQAEGTCRGRADLKAGVMVDVTGVGRRFSGVYYLVSATHVHAPRRGYTTAFSLRRNVT